MRHHVVFGAAALSSLFIQTVVAGPIALGIFLAVPVAISLISTGLGIGCANADKDDVGTDRDSNNCRKGKRSLQDLQMERDAELWAANMTESVKRDGLNLPGVPQFVRDQCMAEVTKTTIVVTGPIGNNGSFVPVLRDACCMTD